MLQLRWYFGLGSRFSTTRGNVGTGVDRVGSCQRQGLCDLGVADVILANVASWVMVAYQLSALIRFKIDIWTC